MGSEKTATVKLALNDASYLSSLKNVTSQNEAAAKKTESVWKSSGVAGLKAARSELVNMAGAVKSTVSLVAGLGGSFSLATAVHDAIDLRSEFKQIAVDIREGSGRVVDFNALMQDAQTEAKKWGLSSKELGAAMKEVNEETGNLDFARDAMRAVAVTARASGESVGTLATVAGKLGEKFEVSGEQMPQALATVISLSKQGGLHFEDMAGAIDRVGSSAKLAGIQGVDGFSRLIGMANLAKGDAKNVRGALQGVMQIVEEMAKPEFGKKIAQQFGVMTKDSKGQVKDFTKVLGEIFAATGGKKELLARGFEGEQLKVVNDLGSVFRETFESTTGTVQQRTKAALAAYEAHLKEASQTHMTAAEMQKLATERSSSPAANMQRAMEALSAAFTKPEMMDGLLRIAQIAPKAADRLSKLIEFAFEHPAMAAGIFAGMKLGVPLLQGALVEGLKIGGPALGRAVMGALGQGGGAISGGASGALGKAAGVMGAVGAVAAAGAVGYEVASAYADNVVDPSRKRSAEVAGGLQGATIAASINTTGRIDPARAAESLEQLRQKLDQARKDKQFSMADVYTLGLRRIGTASDADINKGQAAYDQGVAALNEKMGPAAEKTAAHLSDVNEALQTFAANLRGGAPATGGGAGASRGPIRTTPSTPGYADR